MLVSSHELCCGKLACRVIAASTPLQLYSRMESHPGELDTIPCVPRSVDKQVLIMCVAFRNGIFPAVCYSSWKGSGYLIIRVIKARARKFGKQNCSGFIMISILSKFPVKNYIYNLLDRFNVRKSLATVTGESQIRMCKNKFFLQFHS